MTGYLVIKPLPKLCSKIIDKKLLPFIFFCITFFPSAYTQKVNINGFVYNKANNIPLPHATVVDKTTLQGTTTNDSGYFNISLDKGEHSLEFSYLGFDHYDTSVFIDSRMEISVYLNPVNISINEVSVVGEGIKDNVSSTLMGAFTFKSKDIMELPSLLGETDVLQVLKLSPGVQTGAEVNTGFYVRGGGTDQNLVLYDNAIVYNPGHLLGFFSVFHPEMIKEIGIIKSGIPAQYGGKLSSVINLKSNRGNRDSVEVLGNIGLISSRMMINGPWLKNRGTFIIGARHTYLGLLAEPIARNVSGETSFLSKKNRYDFGDFNIGGSVQINSKNLISFSGYAGVDKYRIKQEDIKYQSSLEWGNRIASVTWNHDISSKVSLTTSTSWSKYKFDLTGSQLDYSFGLLSAIEDYSLKSELAIKSKRNIITGIELINHTFTPNKIDAKAKEVVLNFGQFNTLHALEGGIFYDEEYHISNKITLAGGIRLSFFNHHGPYKEYIRNSQDQITDSVSYPWNKSLAFFLNPEPRMVFKYQVNGQSSVKASYMRIAQYVHLATSAASSLPTDIWIPSTSKIKPMTGNQGSIGYFRKYPVSGFEFSTEIYYKKMNSQLEFLKGIVYNSIDGNIENNIESGEGQSYGLELFIRKKTGNTTGQLSYTLSRTEKKFANINGGKPYPAKYDRRHDLSLTLVRKFDDKWEGSLVFVFLSGNAFTIPVGRYIISGNIVNEPGTINSFRMPPYNRMDVSMTRKIYFRNKWTSELAFSVYNIYNRANPYYLYFEVKADLDEFSLEINPVEVTLFPIIPSISWSFKF